METLTILIFITLFLLIGILLILIIEKIKQRKVLIRFKVLIISLSILTSINLYLVIYLNTYYKAQDSAYSYLESTDTVEVIKDSNGYLFDGDGKELIVFYPGAKVEAEAYAPLMMTIADSGYDCFLVKMPFNIAFFGINKANDVLNDYNYDACYMMGHSLGGVIASNYASKNKDKVNGLIFLASYSTKKIDDDIKTLSIYGSLDGVLNINKYNESKRNFPSDYKEVVIEGGNHTQFAFYDLQDKDNEATISYIDQINKVRDEIVSYFTKYKRSGLNRFFFISN